MLAFIPFVKAIWPFAPKRFTSNSFMGAGSLGLSDSGRVVAFGDLNGDQLYVNICDSRTMLFMLIPYSSMDVLMLDKDQQTVTPYLWSHGKSILPRGEGRLVSESNIM